MKQLLIILSILIILFGIIICNEKRVIDENIITPHDILIKRNNKNQEEAYIEVLQLKNKKQLLQLKTSDSTIIKLQELVDKYKGELNSAIILSNITSVKGSDITIITKENIINGLDTTEIISYETSWSNKWEEGYIKATQDSIIRDIRIKNEFEIVIGNEKRKMFKKGLYEIKIVNLNPNTYTKEIKTFQVKKENPRFSLGIQLGYGIGLLDFKPQPYLGVGIQYNLIK